MSLSLFFSDQLAVRRDVPSRIVALLLSVLMLLLFGLVVLRMGILGDSGKGRGSQLTAVNLSAASKADAHKAQAKSAPHTTHATTVPQPRQPQPVTPKPVTPSFIHLSHTDFAAADISKLPSHRDEAASSSAGSASASYGPGEGPGGAHLYNAEWYREPAHAALASYLPGGAPPGSWAMIACRTVAAYHVEDCQEMDESPPGSGLARALRQAAWQFLVRPPRLNGQPMIGAWVKIRFDFTRKGEKSDD